MQARLLNEICTIYGKLIVVAVKIAANCTALCLNYNSLYFGVTSTGTSCIYAIHPMYTTCTNMIISQTKTFKLALEIGRNFSARVQFCSSSRNCHVQFGILYTIKTGFKFIKYSVQRFDCIVIRTYWLMWHKRKKSSSTQ